ncbi:hypothetical protein KW792_00495 [Candidatus Saccharibacteria bacterium]|nr:hypothetical protein [Candidatus Saccharibacteria bacterium]
MTITNHAVTGALVAAAIDRPLIALPAALLSHFLIDALPHWDYYKLAKTKKGKRALVSIDALLAFGLLSILALSVNAAPWIIFLGGCLGILPDVMWARFILHGKPSITGNRGSLINTIRRYHINIQWLETNKIAGLYAEVIWLAFTMWMIYRI